MNKKINSRKERFLKELPENLIENSIGNFQNKINFNFAFFDSSQGEDFKDWNQKQLSELLNKLKNYSKESLEYWKSKRIGTKDSKVLVVYGNFPQKSDFKHPKHIPLNVDWARFRLEGDDRLIGFVISGNDCSSFNLCKNTFYVVFLDEDHCFYKSKK